MDSFVQNEIDEAYALMADMDEEEDMSWLEQIELNHSKNQSANESAIAQLDDSIEGFDKNVANSWLFPVQNGVEKRDYQLNISKSSLFSNTLVILPTGLGKTFIAAVTMYNFMRWFPKSKIIFMAPTRPLVNQQMSACYDIVGIPKDETTEMTGKITKKGKRKELWDSKKVFFATPQVVQSDIQEGIFPIELVKLIVVDEAHKAKGEYAYCKVIREIFKIQKNFRVLALTATAGKTSDVVQIIQNLLISKIEYRSEQSIDVRPYTHKKNIEIMNVKLNKDLQGIHRNFILTIDPIIKELKQAGCLRTNSTSKGSLIMEQKRMRENNYYTFEQKKELNSLFSSAVGFYHSLEMLERHGIHLFLKSLKDEKSNYKYFIARDFKLKQYVQDLDQKYEEHNPFLINVDPLPNGTIPGFCDKQIDYGHPKFDVLKSKIEDYFKNNGAKAIIFCEYRDTTTLIYRMLLQLRPLVLSRCLIGQGGNISQKDQLKIMKEFRDGSINTLVCTCVAEEGLDIGDVDLVVCFDISSKNATRFVQRIGRTARKRTGKVIVLATEGRELMMTRDLVYSKDAVNRSITRSKEIDKFFYKSLRLIPNNCQPKCIETKFFIADDDENQEEEMSAKDKKKSNKKNSKKDPKPGSSKGSIMNHFKPSTRSSKTNIDAIENLPIVEVDDVERIDAMEVEDIEIINQAEIIDSANNTNQDEPIEIIHKIDVNELISKYCTEDDIVLKEYIKFLANKEIKDMECLMNALSKKIEPYKDADEPNLDYNFGKLDLSTDESKKEEKKIPEIEKKNNDYETQDFCVELEVTSRYGNQFSLYKSRKSTFTPVRTIFDNSPNVMQYQRNRSESLSPKKDDNKTPCSQFGSPYRNFHDHHAGISASTPVTSRHQQPSKRKNRILHSPSDFDHEEIQQKPKTCLINSHMMLNIHQHDQQSKSTSYRLPRNDFLGIFSVDDIFAGCETRIEEQEKTQDQDHVMEEIDLQNTDKKEALSLEHDDEQEILQKLEEKDELPPENNEDKICSQDLNRQDVYSQELDDVEHIESSIPECNIIDSSIPSANSHIIFKKFRLDDLDDLFEVPALNDADENILDVALSDASGKTEIYEIADEIEKNELIRLSSQKENIETFNGQSVNIPKPNLSRFFNSTSTSSIRQNKNIESPMKDRNLKNLGFSYSSPDCVLKQSPSLNKSIVAQCDTTPELDLRNRDMYEIPSQSPVTHNVNKSASSTSPSYSRTLNIRRRVVRRKKRHHLSFIQTQAGVDDDASSDEDENELTTLNGFIDNNDTHVHHDQTTMYMKYVKSLQSPSAPKNIFLKRNLPVVSDSQIFSQIPVDDDETDDEEMDSFIVDNDEENERSIESEPDELEIAERLLKQKRRMKGKTTNINKRRKIIKIHDDSSEDEIEKLRRELMNE